MRALFAWIALSVACATPSTKTPDERSFTPDSDNVLTCWTKNRKAVFVLRTGQSYRCVLSVRNTSDAPIALESLSFVDNRAQRKIEMASNPMGRFSKTDEGRYVLHQQVTDIAKLALWTVVVPPGEARPIEFEFLPLNPRERLEVRFVALPSSVKVYRGDGSRFYLADQDELFEPLEDDKLLIPAAGTLTREARTYAVATAEGLRMPLWVAKGAAQRLLSETSTAGQAAAQTQEANFDLRLLPSSGDYLVVPDDRSVPCFRLRTPDQMTRGPDLPHDGDVVQEILEKAPRVWVKVGDEQKGIGPQRRPPHRRFLGRWDVFYGDGRTRRGEFIDVAPSDWGALLDYLVRNDLRLIKVYYFFDQYYFKIAKKS